MFSLCFPVFFVPPDFPVFASYKRNAAVSVPDFLLSVKLPDVEMLT